eukprot:1156475-Pelagomonas_calceolata.AAC.7
MHRKNAQAVVICIELHSTFIAMALMFKPMHALAVLPVCPAGRHGLITGPSNTCSFCDTLTVMRFHG